MVSSVAPITRSMLGAGVVAACWAGGEGIDRATGLLPGPVLGLVLLAALLTARPSLHEVVAPVADVLLRVLPLLFVPAVVAVGAVAGDVEVAAAVVACAVSVPVGFAIAARVAR